MTNEEVAALLDVSIAEVEELGDELEVDDDEWTVEDLYAADGLLESEDSDEQ